MGYDTNFKGKFSLNRALDDETYELLMGLASTRRMKRVGLDSKYGTDGEFYYCKSTCFGQERTKDIVDFNTPPSTQPGLWLQWIPTEDRLHIEWDGQEKFYNYVEWLEYLIDRILIPRGYTLQGEVEWYGDARDDLGIIIVENNVVKTGRVTAFNYDFDS